MRQGPEALVLRRPASGFALPLAVFALAVVGALVGAAFWLGVAERRAGSAVMALPRALGEAERAMHDRLVSWPSGLNTLPVGSEASDTAFWSEGGVRSVTTVRRLGPATFLVTGVGHSENRAARQTASRLVRLEMPDLPAREPLVAAGPVALGPHARVDPAEAASESACASGGRSGVAEEATAGRHYEDVSVWASRANHVLPPGTYSLIGPSSSDGDCRTSDSRNWGDPRAPISACGAYRPVIFVIGDVTLAGGIGQGVLAVDGNLTVTGGFEFHGLVLVTGRLVADRAGVHIVGAVQVGDPQRGQVELHGRSRVLHSPCALLRAVAPWSRAVPLRRRSWLSVPE